MRFLILLACIAGALAFTHPMGTRLSEIGVKDKDVATVTWNIPQNLGDYHQVKVRYYKSSAGEQKVWIGSQSTTPAASGTYPSVDLYHTYGVSDTMEFNFCVDIPVNPTNNQVNMQVQGTCTTGTGCLSTTDFVVVGAWIQKNQREDKMLVDANTHCAKYPIVMPYELDRTFDGYHAWMTTATKLGRTSTDKFAQNQWILPAQHIKLADNLEHNIYFKQKLATGGSSAKIQYCFSSTNKFNGTIALDDFTIADQYDLNREICDKGCYPQTYTQECSADEGNPGPTAANAIPLEANGEMYVTMFVVEAASALTDVRLATGIDHPPSAAGATIPSLFVAISLLAALFA